MLRPRSNTDVLAAGVSRAIGSPLQPTTRAIGLRIGAVER